ncbi:MAG TPA: transketolase [Clostridia bacterium]|nr:transketolase [Clostridia bacterium]
MTYSSTFIKELQEKSKQIRRDIVEMVYKAQSGHIGGSLSIAELLVALYYAEMNIDPGNPKWEDRDRFVLSKGHTAPALYTVLADKGYFPKEYLFNSFRSINSILQGHPDMKKTPGIDMTTGSLGIGLSAACGMALGAKITGKGFRVYTIIGDGETNEGQIWEAAMTAAHYKLDNLTAFIDVNRLQNDGFTSDVMNTEPMDEKWNSFGWNVLDIDGHNMGEVLEAIDSSKIYRGKPTAIICRTVKGKGVSFMENSVTFHGASPNDEQYEKAMEELA